MRKIFILIFAMLSLSAAQAQCPQYLAFDTSICHSSVNRVIDARVLTTRLCGDSVQVIFNDSLTALNGANKVYFHAGPEFRAFTGWQTAYTADSAMQKIGNHLWSIKFNPHNFFHYSPDSCLNSIACGFRDSNYVHYVKDGANDIYILTYTGAATTTYPYVTCSYTHNTSATYAWSDGRTDSVRLFVSAGTYSVTATGPGGCTATGTVRIRIGNNNVSLGNDTVFCTSGYVLVPTPGFASYRWGNGTTSSTYIGFNPGRIWVRATDSVGCLSYDTVTVHYSQTWGLKLGDTLRSCPGNPVSSDASININRAGDSLVIIYDATQGQTQLANDTNVYFHSGPEFRPFGGWNLPYTRGSFTQNDGLGRMTSLGNHRWRIAIDPQAYYGYLPDSTLNGVFMVFRNFDGTKTGKDAAGNDIFVYTAGVFPFHNLRVQPTCAFAGVTPSLTARQPLTYIWSNGATTAADTFTSGGVYRVTVSDGVCSRTDSVLAIFSAISNINLGADTTVCTGQHVVINAGSGFAHYIWSNGDTTASINVTAAALYTVTATSAGGCQSVGSRRVSNSNRQVSLGSDITRCTNTATSITATSGYLSYSWIGRTAATASTYSALNAGCYWVKAIDSFGCASYDTVRVINSPVSYLSLADTVTSCPGNTIPLNASTTISQNGDSIIIIYDATKHSNTDSLVGAHKVYMHSGPEFHPFQGWQTAYTVGNFGQDDGVGQMDSIGPNLWRIAIIPQCYYSYSPDTPLNGIWMIFRDATGAHTGKNYSNADIFVLTAGVAPSCSFNGVIPSRSAVSGVTYSWSTPSGSVSGPSVSAASNGLYIVTASAGLCSKSDTVRAIFTTTTTLNLGADTTVCAGQHVVINTGGGFAHYIWSNGDTNASINVTASVVYSVTATTAGGCQSVGSRRVTSSSHLLSLGTDITRCSNTATTIAASNGFVSYSWIGRASGTASTYSAVNAGCYWVKAIDSAGCASYDTVRVINSPVSYLNLADTVTSCPGNTIPLDASTTISQNGDSIIIIYDATKHSNADSVVGAHKVYMHSGPEFHPFQGWQTAYTVGNFGQDDGIGRMDSIGPNLWRIAIIPQCYYGYSPDTALNGIWMIFRDATGTHTGKNYSNADIFVLTSGVTPSCSFNGVIPSRSAVSGVTYSWSTPSGAVSGASVNATTNGLYIVTASVGICNAVDTVHAIFSNTAPLNIGRDTTLCFGDSLRMDAGAGYAHYVWSTGDTVRAITVRTAATYSVTVTNGTGCSSVGHKIVSVSHPSVSLGADQVLCTAAPYALTAPSGFASYRWLSRAASAVNSISVNKTGCYWVSATDSFGCVAKDTISVRYSAVLSENLQDTFRTCPGNQVNLDAATMITLAGDSITIFYDATQGQTGLVGAHKVYMHSAPEFFPFTGWQGNYTVGNYGQDDGIGQMDSLGNNRWKITICPQCYYHYSPDTPLNGIFIVFRDATGANTGKDNAGNNIFLNLSTATPTSSFTGVTAIHKAAGTLSYAWTPGGSTSPAIAVGTSGQYIVTVTDNSGCSKTDTTNVVIASTLTVNIGRDTTICPSGHVTFDAGAGFTAYHWNTGDTTRTITVSAAGIYSVTVNNGNCIALDSASVAMSGVKINLGADVTRCSSTPVILTAPSGYRVYQWFGVGVSSVTRSAVNDGCYWIKATDSSGCTSYDTLSVSTSGVSGLHAHDTVKVCTGDSTSFDASVTVNAKGDSLVIVYDATKGLTQLQGDTNIYFHSGPEFHSFTGWQTGYTVGNFNQNNGVGRMTSLGNNKWSITICPSCYYHFSPDTPLAGIFCVFRNFDGTKTGKDSAGNGDIYLNLQGATPVSSFDGISAHYKSGSVSYAWSTGATTAVANFATAGTYYVTATEGSCTKIDTVLVNAYSKPIVNLGNDTCTTAASVTLNAGAGFASYVWSTGASTQIISANLAQLYTVTVTNANGCKGTDSLIVSRGVSVHLGRDTCVDAGSSILLHATTGAVNYSWNTGASTDTLRVTAAGVYSVTASTGGCSSRDTVVVTTCNHGIPGCKPIAHFRILNVSHSNIVTIRDSSTRAVTYLWNYGDGTTDTTRGSNVHIYAHTGPYTITLIVTDSCGSDTMSVLVNVNTAINEVEGISGISLQPNPAATACMMIVNADRSAEVQISISDLLGAVVQTEKVQLIAGENKLVLGLSGLAAGMYNVTLRAADGMVTRKLNIIK